MRALTHQHTRRVDPAMHQRRQILGGTRRQRQWATTKQTLTQMPPPDEVSDG